MMLSVKQKEVKYHFWSLWYDLTWDRTPVSFGKHSNQWTGLAIKRVENLRYWTNVKRKSMQLVIPMIWREAKDYIIHSYLCVINLKGINSKNKYHVQYPDVPSDIKLIPHGPELSVLGQDCNMEYSTDSEHSEMTAVAIRRQPALTQAEVNDLTRDLNCTSESNQLLGSCL